MDTLLLSICNNILIIKNVFKALEWKAKIHIFHFRHKNWHFITITNKFFALEVKILGHQMACKTPKKAKNDFFQMP